jgi:hypothetical protein
VSQASSGPDPGPDHGRTPPDGWDAPTPPRGESADHRPATATGSFVAPGSWTRPAGVPRAADRRARGRRQAGRPTPPAGFPVTRPPRPDRLAGTRRRLVGLARVLAGGTVVLAVVVVVAPWLLGGPGPGTDTVVGHLVAAVGAVGATALAAHRRTRPVVSVVAAAAVPVILFVLLAVVWWQ